MGSSFIYRLNVSGTTKGTKTRFQEQIPVYAIKPGDNSSQWPGFTQNLGEFEQIALGADGARMLTVSSIDLYCLRGLQDKEIDDFTLFIEDARPGKPFDINQRYIPEPRRVVGTIHCRDMNGGKMEKVGDEAKRMSTEPINSSRLFAVVLSFWDSSSGPVFTRT